MKEPAPTAELKSAPERSTPSIEIAETMDPESGPKKISAEVLSNWRPLCDETVPDPDPAVDEVILQVVGGAAVAAFGTATAIVVNKLTEAINVTAFRRLRPSRRCSTALAGIRELNLLTI